MNYNFAWRRDRQTPWHATGKWPFTDVRVMLVEPIERGLAVLDFGEDVRSSVTMVIHTRPGGFPQLADGFASSPISVETRFGRLLAWITEIRSDGSMLLWFQREQAEAIMRKCGMLAPQND